MKRELIIGEWQRVVESLGAAETLLRERYETSVICKQINKIKP